jgi:hypothetical protein
VKPVGRRAAGEVKPTRDVKGMSEKNDGRDSCRLPSMRIVPLPSALPVDTTITVIAWRSPSVESSERDALARASA